MVRRKGCTSLLLLTMFILSSLAPILTSAQTSGRAQTTWSNEMTLNSDYTIAVTDELVVSACTNITLGNNARIYVEGRLTIEGTQSCPVYIDYAGGQDHRGIQFNTTSNGRGSKIDNLSIVHSVYGVTIYGSNPYIANLTVYDADDVAVDLFNSATPTIRDLKVIEGGQDWTFPSYWRYGIGLSIGAGSAPNVDGVEMSNLVTRGLNFWGNSGGLFRNISIDNVTGATLGMAAGIWIEDSRPLIEYASVDKADHGAIVRHINDSITTRSVFRDLEITNSMYKALLIDKEDHTNYTNYQSAIIEGLYISGTGGAGAKTAGLATSTVEVNATGAWIEDAVIEDNAAVGLRLYFVDSTSTFTNWTINNTGEVGAGAHSAGVAIRSSYFAATLNNLEVSNAPGPGVYSSNGGAIQGTNWNLHDNGEEGFYLNSAATIVDGLSLSNNGDSGVHINEGRYVFLSNLTSEGNADAGLEFSRSNDIEATSGDVRCESCITRNNERGIVLSDSVDIYLENIEVHDPINGSAIDIDNSGLTVGVQGGNFHLANVELWTNNSLPAIKIVQAEGEINGLDMYGTHGGIDWDADHNVERQSMMSNVNLSGTACLSLSNHDQMTGIGNTITSDCSGNLTFINSEVNWSGLTDVSNHVFDLDANSHLHLHQPTGIDYASVIMQAGAWIDVAWDLDIWVVNNFSNGIPNAALDINFDQLENNFSVTADQLGHSVVVDLIGKRYTYNGETPYTTVSIDCAYDGTSNTTTTTLNQNQNVWCHLPLQNQAPFLIWDTPIDEEIFPSHASINFNASRTWDLDNDSISWEWSSSIDGVIGIHSQFMVNDDSFAPQLLSDGVHIITAKVCDAGHCVEENRTIELSNQPPIIVLNVDPILTSSGELHIAITEPFAFWLNGTFDPEGDLMTCGWTWPDHSVNGTDETMDSDIDCGNYSDNLSFVDMTLMNFILTLAVSDGINEPSEWQIPVTLFNEMPIASFTTSRDGNYSEDEITLTSTSIDPEDDSIEYLWSSNIDGVLSNESVWIGHLSRGNHVITLSVNDGRAEHLNQTSENSTIIIVENSPPKAIISSPANGLNYDSSHLFEFNSSGSGDWDSACYTFPPNITWHCTESEPYAGSEWLVYSWESDIDGRLTENGEDWLIFESYLSSGTHTITLTIDDGINSPVTTSVIVEISPSAPVLGIVLPDLNQGYHSSDTIYVDVSESIDNDGDNFTFTLESDLLGDAIIEDADPFAVHQISLPAGEHVLSFTLTDETGLSRVETRQLLVVESDPKAIIYEPLNNQNYAPGETIILDSNGTNDADDDLTKREWRLHITGEIYPEILSNDAYHTLNLLPGAHHISLYVEDRRGGSDEVHINITSYSSNPDLSNLTVNSDDFYIGETALIIVSVHLDDPDGTTTHVEANLSNGLQQWTFNLSDDDGDGIWTGELEIIPNEKGEPYLKVTAYDGDVHDYLTYNLKFKPIVEDNSSMIMVGGSVAGFMIISLLIAALIIRRRKKMADLELIDNWGVFGSEKKEYVEEIGLED